MFSVEVPMPLRASICRGCRLAKLKFGFELPSFGAAQEMQRISPCERHD